MSEFKVGDKVVWVDKEYAKTWYPEIVDEVLTVSKVDDNLLNEYITFYEFDHGELVLAERFKKYSDEQGEQMKIRVNTYKYEYMGLTYGSVVECTLDDIRWIYQFTLNGKHWELGFHEAEQVKEVPTKEVDMVSSPPHYILFNKDEIEGDVIEVKHVVKAILERWEKQDKISFEMYQGGCYKEMLQYLLRAPCKNNIEDVQKAKWYIDEILNEW